MIRRHTGSGRAGLLPGRAGVAGDLPATTAGASSAVDSGHQAGAAFATVAAVTAVTDQLGVAALAAVATVAAVAVDTAGGG
ncbi:hypothetical protein TMIG_03814, partial [Mycobacterium tuberculosis SUMu009]